MRTFFTLILIITYLSGGSVVYAGSSDISNLKNTLLQLNIIDESYFSNANVVSREECIVAIMRVIGATDEEIEKLNGGDLICFADTAPFSYFGCAWLGKIAYGEECVIDYPTHRTSHTLKNTDLFFFPERAVTVKETIAFMVRCLEENNRSDINDTFEGAKDYGILNTKDSFINNADLPINQNDFYILLGRLLQQKRYKYYGRENNIFSMAGNIDEYRSMSYFDMLNNRQRN